MSDDLKDIDIRHLRLTDGDEIISYILEARGDTIILDQPMLLNLVEEKSDRYTYYFTKYSPFSRTGTVNLNTVNIVSYTNPTDDVKERYIKSAIKLQKPTSIDDLENSVTYDDFDDMHAQQTNTYH